MSRGLNTPWQIGGFDFDVEGNVLRDRVGKLVFKVQNPTAYVSNPAVYQKDMAALTKVIQVSVNNHDYLVERLKRYEEALVEISKIAFLSGNYTIGGITYKALHDRPENLRLLDEVVKEFEEND